MVSDPAPIGAVLTPQLRGVASAADASLPYASTLCGACVDVCPVQIPLPDLLVHMRHKVVEAKAHGRPPADGCRDAGRREGLGFPRRLGRDHQRAP